MKLEQGVTFGDLAGSLRGRLDNLPPLISEAFDSLQRLSGRNTREEVFVDMIVYYEKYRNAISKNREGISIDRDDIEKLRMKEIKFYSLTPQETY